MKKLRQCDSLLDNNNFDIIISMYHVCDVHTKIAFLCHTSLQIIIILFIERHFQLAVRGALQHSEA